MLLPNLSITIAELGCYKVTAEANVVYCYFFLGFQCQGQGFDSNGTHILIKCMPCHTLVKYINAKC